MKKIILGILLVGSMTLCSGCNSVESKINHEEKSRFVVVEECAIWELVYDKNTKVMYVISTGGYNGGNFTMLVNADGTPVLYDGE